MFEAFRDETYGRRNLVVAGVLALVAVAVVGVTWAFSGPVLSTLAVALLAGLLGLIWWTLYIVAPVESWLSTRDVSHKSARRRRKSSDGR
jgi:preprotein translocase subunit SecF